MYSLGFLSNDTDLLNIFRGIEHFTEFKTFNRIEDINDRTDILIISDGLVKANEIIEYRELLEAKYIFYMVSSENFNYTENNVLLANNVNIIPPKLTLHQIVKRVCDTVLINVKEDNNIFVFYGADEKVGTTMISQSVAEMISQNKDLRVFYTFLGGTPGVDYLNANFTMSLDDIKVKLFNNILSVNELLDACVKFKNLYVLKGVVSLLYRRHYHPKHIEHLLKLLSKEFDVVIIDAGSNIELGMTIGALNSTPNKFLVATQQEKSLCNFNIIKEQIFSKLKINNFMLIVNKYIENDTLYNPFQVAETYKSPFLCKLPYLEWGWQCEKEKRTLLNFNNAEYVKGIEAIVSVISKNLNIEFGEVQVNKSSWFKKLKSKLIS